MKVTTRFAPSPTGHLHVGNIRTALHNWLWARKHGGRFVLRIDDTDLERSSEEYVEAIRGDLSWLGLEWDLEVRQSERFALYDEKFEALKAGGRVYACYETPEELDLRRKVLLGRGLPPVYERKAADAPAPEGVAPHWRFKLDHDAPIEWGDLIRGPQQFDPKLLSDPVIRRADGSWLYMLPSAIDDIDLGITHVVRGEDHVTNTAAQLQMFSALGAAPPAFAHEALLTGSEGKLSKRLGSMGMAQFRDEGIEPIALIDKLARLGTSDPVEPFTNIQPLIESVDFARFGRAPARFDEEELRQLNAKVLHQTEYQAVADRLPPGLTKEDWDIVRANVVTLNDTFHWVAVIHDAVSFTTDEANADLLLEAAGIAETLDWLNDPWRALTAAMKDRTGRKGRELFLPLRLALTGREHGPEMAALLPLIEKEIAVGRLLAVAGK